MNMMARSKCAAVPTTQTRNLTGQEQDQTPTPFGLSAAWLHFANELELRRLAKLQARINRRQRAVNELVSERQKIMNRCIRRMRRASGKN